MSHYTVMTDTETAEWFFTSPLGRHGGFMTEPACERIMAKIAVAHARRSSEDTIEGRLLADYFAEMGKPEISEEALSTRPLVPPAILCKEPFKYHAWPVPFTDESQCVRCGAVRSEFNKHHRQIQHRRQQARKLEQALGL